MNNRVVTSAWRHDMKNHLGIVLGFADLMLGEIEPDHPRRQDLEDIVTAVRAAMALLDELDRQPPLPGP